MTSENYLSRRHSMSSANETASEMAIKEEEPCVILEIPSTKVKK